MDTKKITIVIAGAALIYLLMKTSTAFASPTKSSILRGKDPLGDGAFGASRSGGTRKHSGIDFRTAPGEAIFAPISGTVTRVAYPYADDMRYTGVEIKNGSYTVKMFYLSPTIKIGSTVSAGQQIGIAQDISAKHGAAMINHVHFEVYDTTGKLLNPTGLIPGISLNMNLILSKGLMNSPEVAELQRRLGIIADGDFGQLTEAALLKAKGVRQIALKSL